jgi:hypothetical protein
MEIKASFKAVDLADVLSLKDTLFCDSLQLNNGNAKVNNRMMFLDFILFCFILYYNYKDNVCVLKNKDIEEK